MIHNFLISIAARGTAILLISSEISELIKLSHRLAVIYRGAISDIFSAKEASPERIGLLMAGSGR